MAKRSDSGGAFFSSKSRWGKKVPGAKLNVKKLPTYAAHKENRVREKLGANQTPEQVKEQVKRQEEFFDQMAAARRELGTEPSEAVDLSEFDKPAK